MSARTRIAVFMLGSLLLHAALAAPPAPWAGRVVVVGPGEASTSRLADPGLTEAGPAADRALAGDALLLVETRGRNMLQRIPLLAGVGRLCAVDAGQLDADALALQGFFRAHGWPAATVRWELRPGRNERRQDVVFVAELGEGGPYPGFRHQDAAPEAGWFVSPVGNALARGTNWSVYGGLESRWLGDAERPSEIDLHAEVGARAFPERGSHSLLGAGGGLWTDVHGVWRYPVGEVTSLVVRGAGYTDAWPVENDDELELAVGLQQRLGDSGTLALSARGQRWRSWAWSSQRSAYDRWFGETQELRFLPEVDELVLDARLEIDSTDRRVAPRRGARLVIDAVPVGVASGAFFAKAEADARGFVPVVPERLIGSIRARAGANFVPRPDGALLLNERFFLGAADLRSWGRRRVLPPDYPSVRGDLLVGGDVLAYLSGDLRWHVHPDLAVTGFLNTGRVWESGTFDLRDLLVESGFALEVASPVGVIRAEVASPLVGQVTDPDTVVAARLWINPGW